MAHQNFKVVCKDAGPVGNHERSSSGDSSEGVLLCASDLARSNSGSCQSSFHNNNNTEPFAKDSEKCDSKNGCVGFNMGQAGNFSKSKMNETCSDSGTGIEIDEVDCLKPAPTLPNFDVTKTVAFKRLESKLEATENDLKLKEEQVLKLSEIREKLESELHELTASLFQEAHLMVNDANVKAAAAEKSLFEAKMKIDGLETEVAALKTLVLTSTPARPNRHLHHKTDSRCNLSKSRPSSASSSMTTSGSPISANGLVSNGVIANGSIIVGAGGLLGAKADDIVDDESSCCCQDERPPPEKLFDPGLRKDFLTWKKDPSFDRGTSDFLERLYREDIDLCLDFPNEELGRVLRLSIEQNSLCINPLSGREFEDNTLPNTCALFQAQILCRFQVRILPSENCDSNDEVTFYVCQLARNRITSVCDCLTYLRYIKQGLVKSHHNEVYWHVLECRRKMALARLGFTPE